MVEEDNTKPSLEYEESPLIDAALEGIDFSPKLEEPLELPSPQPIKRSCPSPLRSELGPQVHQKTQPQVAPTYRNVRKMAPRSQSDIRRFLSASSSSQQPQMPPFAYLQDIYYRLQQYRGVGTEVCAVRGVLVSLQSHLEHHEGRYWSLTIRLADGTATVDADMEDDLLRRLIGVSAMEAEGMKLLGRQGNEVNLAAP